MQQTNVEPIPNEQLDQVDFKDEATDDKTKDIVAYEIEQEAHEIFKRVNAASEVNKKFPNTETKNTFDTITAMRQLDTLEQVAKRLRAYNRVGKSIDRYRAKIKDRTNKLDS